MGRCDLEFALVEKNEEANTRVKIGKDLKGYYKMFQELSEKTEDVEFIKSSRDYDYFMIKGDFLNNGRKIKKV